MDWRSPEYWRNLRPEVAVGWPDEHPPPRATTRDPRPPEAPSDPLGVVRLIAAARGEGWEVRVGYSAGAHRAVKTGTYRWVEAIGVGMLRPPWRCLVVYERPMGTPGTGGFTAQRTAIWRTDGLPVAGPSSMLWFTHATVTDVKEFIAMRQDPRPAWFKAVHAREEEKAAKARANAQRSQKTKREGQS